jgi:hypothetical protein
LGPFPAKVSQIFPRGTLKKAISRLSTDSYTKCPIFAILSAHIFSHPRFSKNNYPPGILPSFQPEVNTKMREMYHYAYFAYFSFKVIEEYAVPQGAKSLGE